jgi:hypothetical protein
MDSFCLQLQWDRERERGEWLRQHDLGEELLRVAPDLHGSLGADVHCTHARTNERTEKKSVSASPRPDEEGTRRAAGCLVCGARRDRAAAGPRGTDRARPPSTSPAAS